MTPVPQNRRLAAVLFADVAGYSRLMERDETGTHVRVGRVFAEAAEPSITRNAGRLIKRTGDGILAEFPSATSALRCAIEVQRQVEERNTPVRPRDQIRLRIGINVADVLVDDQDIAGGGVNLASRLETLASPGGICISQALKEQIQEDLGVEFVDCGTKRVKNISRPVRVFEVLPTSASAIVRWRARMRPAFMFPRWVWGAGLVATIAVAIPLAWRWVQPAEQQELDRLSVTVLPFRSNSVDLATNELASQMQRRLLLALSPESNLLSVKGLGAEAMPDAQWDLQRVRINLKARYALVGEVSGSDRARRVEARLLNTESNAAVWGDTIEIPHHLNDAALEIVARRITPALVQKVSELEIARVAKSPPSTPDAMDHMLLGWGEMFTRKPGWSDRMDERVRQALAANPRFVPALLTRAEMLNARAGSSPDAHDRATLVREADQLTLSAVKADPECAASWTMRANVLGAMGQLDAALASAEKAVRLNAANAYAVSQYNELLIAAGRAREVILPLDEVTLIYEKLNLTEFLQSQCLARVYAAHLEDAPTVCETWYAMGGNASALRALASIYGNRGEPGKAAKAVAELLRAEPDASIGTIRKAWLPNESTYPLLASQAEATFYAGLRRTNLPE